MKITKSQLKQIIEEELEEANRSDPHPAPAALPSVREQSINRQIIVLLREIVSQLKMLNQYATPAKGRGASELEKAVSSFTVAEELK